MGNEGFFQRWARLKSDDSAQQLQPPPAPALPAAPAIAPGGPAPAPTGAAPARLPTLEDAALLTTGSDYSTFVARGVDKSVQRLAMKKLFSDPHFNVLDGLDIYMGDYNLASPVSAAMLATLQHADSFFASAADVEAKALARLEAERQAAALPDARDGQAAGDEGDGDVNEGDGVVDDGVVDNGVVDEGDGDAPAPLSKSGHDGSAQLFSTQQANPDAALQERRPSIEGIE